MPHGINSDEGKYNGKSAPDGDFSEGGLDFSPSIPSAKSPYGVLSPLYLPPSLFH